MAAEYQAILDYWFGDIEGEVTTTNKGALWFQGGADVDQYITDNFLPLVSKAGTGELAYWAKEPRGALALIILLDQFSRNIYRGLSAAFRNDALALAICKRGLAQNIDQQLSPIERVFFYLPLEHSEVLEDQEECVFRFEQLRQLVSNENRDMFDGFYDYAIKHCDVVKAFGRFPHRNAAHGRLSTTEELAWLHEGGQRFGQ
ncbi:DUF924 family protein [Photobacterium sanguinicancri]|uniref:DUF924 family protein n=1 Tax=Photobacterium sanguinicancri TaxID=875932 RepID=A0AAW7XYK8_9GAMM|nr:DUF924 family protein [Photobacterium sanguinicancri]MDO6497429.1 DUF924 family protein [Photobacterium sanguinicancri]MDO6540945.1 DUF924 family protein [Photobacterium sanguinicancri]